MNEKTATIRVCRDLHRALKFRAVAESKTLFEVTTDAVLLYLKAKEKDENSD